MEKTRERKGRRGKRIGKMERQGEGIRKREDLVLPLSGLLE